MKIYKLICIVCLFFVISCQPEEVVSFGIISDVHQDIMHDSESRLNRFVEEMNTLQPNFVIQLGDFCRPYDYNQNFLDIYNEFKGPRYHVIGNHDMDGGFSRDSVLSFWRIQNRYYSFDQGGFHFVVLDGNDHNPSPDAPGGYSKYIAKDQLDWLKSDLASTSKLCVLFSHQAFRGSFAIDNAEEVRELLESENTKAGFTKIVASMNGHNHADTVIQINGIYYIEINSSSYDWLGGDYVHESYAKEIHDVFPWLAYTAPYEQPLWALVEISSKGWLRISGKQSAWKGPSPEELGHPGRGDGLAHSSIIRDTLLQF